MATFFQNGVDIGTSAAWGGFTGNNNYVVRYEFTTGPKGASQVGIALNNIWYRQGSASNGYGFKISENPLEYAAAGSSLVPDSVIKPLSYNGTSGYNCTLEAYNLQLKKNTVYYIFVYAAQVNGTEYFTGWNCTNPYIETSGAFTQAGGSLSSISQRVSTGGQVSILMNRLGSAYFAANFKYNGTLLARSEAFSTSLAYTCEREWMRGDINAGSVVIDVSIDIYEDYTCTVKAGESILTAFVLYADEGMRPLFPRNAVSISALNPGARININEFIAGISAAHIGIDEDKIDLSNCAGAGIAGYTLAYRDETVSATAPEFTTEIIPGDTNIICTVIDTRGAQASQSFQISPLPYVPPSLTGAAAMRCDINGEDDQEGAYYKIKASASVTDINGENIGKIYSQIKADGGTWEAERELTGFESGLWSDQWGTRTLLGGSLQADGYTVRLRISDSVGGENSYTLRLYHQRWAMKFNREGTAVGFGMEPAAENALQVPDNWKIYAGGLVLSDSSYGTQLPAEGTEGQIFFLLEST